MTRILDQLFVFFFDACCRYWLRRFFNRPYRLCIFLRSLICVYRHWTRRFALISTALGLKARLRVAVFVGVLQLVLVLLLVMAVGLLIAAHT